MHIFHRHGEDEILKMRLEGFPVRGVERHVAKQSFAVDQRLADGLQLLQHVRPFFIDLGGKFAQRKQIANALGLVVDVARAAKLRAQAHVRKAMSRRRQARFQARLFFHHNLLEAFFIIELHGQEDITQDAQHLVGLTHGGLAADGEICVALSWPLRGRCDRRAVDSAGAFPDPLRQFDVVFGFGADFEQCACEDFRQRQEFLRHGAHVESKVKIDNAVGEDVVIQDL